eukprot:3446076-Rhodomonas_salina.1
MVSEGGRRRSRRSRRPRQLARTSAPSSSTPGAVRQPPPSGRPWRGTKLQVRGPPEPGARGTLGTGALPPPRPR